MNDQIQESLTKLTLNKSGISQLEQGWCVHGARASQQVDQMISNKQISLASATTDALRTKGMASYKEFLSSNAEQIGKLRTKLSNDKTNFNAFFWGGKRRELMLLEYATGLVYFNSLTENEQQGIVAVARRQYDQNNQVMVSWLLGGFVCIALVVALIAGNSGDKKDSNRSRLNAAAITEMIA